MTSKYWFRRRSRSRLTLPGRLRASTIVRVTIPSGRSFMKALDKGKVQLRKVDSAVREEVEKIQSLRIIWIEKVSQVQLLMDHPPNFAGFFPSSYGSPGPSLYRHRFETRNHDQCMPSASSLAGGRRLVVQEPTTTPLKSSGAMLYPL
ncbi:hypothetical protein CDL15_Pgr025001 [Punica granatum]|uniref:Uncharacterized protein n=1 Tax=Punica granatum TaxID=22663 RepID=A0A218W7H0_PUNGR|nr:hypothetical protein CDL15_Pgr025001 [Punica granatum]